MIKIGSLNISAFKLGGADCSIYLGSVKLYPTEELAPQYEGFCKLTINDGSVEELEGSGELKYTMISDYKSTLTSVEIGTLCTSIGQSAFNGCSGLTSIDMPNSVTSIGSYAFSVCSGLTSVTIGSGVTSIGTRAFGDCTSLTSVTIPSSVTSIGAIAFYNCSGLTSVTVESTTPPTLGNNAFKSTNNCPIYVPSESVDVYKAATNWSTYASRIQAIPT